ncbi:MAG: hypothetical protein HQ508_05025 [Candidatus Marinimicrobia bacterium]|nr:hypothetical protein [Candidatus Neomarinimicrobiota bacterium]
MKKMKLEFGYQQPIVSDLSISNSSSHRERRNGEYLQSRPYQHQFQAVANRRWDSDFDVCSPTLNISLQLGILHREK